MLPLANKARPAAPACNAAPAPAVVARAPIPPAVIADPAPVLIWSVTVYAAAVCAAFSALQYATGICAKPGALKQKEASSKHIFFINLCFK